MRLITALMLVAVTVYGQGSQTPIYNGLLQSDLNAAGFKILSSNMADYAGTNMTWNAVTGKFDVTGGVGTVTSITATTPIVVTPSPIVSTGVISLDATSKTNWDTAYTDRLKWDGGATGLTAATGRTSLGLVIGTNVAPATSGSSILYGNGSGGFSNVTIGTNLTFTGGTLNATAGGGGTWGSITGTLSSQTDLQTALDAKLATAGDLSPLFTTTEATQNVAFSLTNAAATTVFGRAAGTSGAPTYSSAPQFLKIGNLTTNGFLKTGSSDGTLSVDTATYLTANQNISLTGDVTGGPSATSIATTIGNNKVTLGMMATMATDSILGRATASTGNVEVLAVLPWADTGDVTRPIDSKVTTLAAGNAGNLNSGTLLAARMPALTGDVTTTAGAVATTLAAGNAGNLNSGTLLAARMPAFTGDVTSAVGTVANVIAANAVTYAKMQAISATSKLLGSSTTTTPVQEITIGSGLTLTGTTLTSSGGSATPGGSTTQVQFNDAGAFNGDAGMIYTKSIPKLTLSGGATGDSRLVLGTLEFQPYGLNNSWFGENVYFDGAGFKYRTTGKAGQFYFFGDEGQFRFYPSGSAGAAAPTYCTFKMGTTGDLGVGSNAMTQAAGSYTGAILHLNPSTSALRLGSGYGFAWSSTTDASVAADTQLSRNSAGVVEVNNGTAGTYRDLKADEFNAVTGFQVNGAAPSNYELTGNGTDYVGKASDIPNGSSAQQTGFSSNTYLAGSVITISAGDFKVGSTYRCMFDMAKTTAGTAAPVITIYIGTNGSTADTAAQTITFAVATGVADTGMFEVWVNFRAVGASATISSVGRCIHNLAATGLTSTGASGSGTVSNSTSSTFNSTAMTKIGCAFNGGTSYVGTNNIVQAYYSNP